MPLDNRTCFQVNLRDALACQLCGRHPQARANYHRGFEYHHIMPRSRGGADTVENLILLCHDCHLQQHPATPSGPRGTSLPANSIEAQAMPQSFSCKTCNHALDPQTVEMNCGWYRCDACNVTTHLFDHFYS